MKNSILTLFTVLTFVMSYGQDRKPDIIQKINGENLTVFVINISEYDVTYSYPNEPVTYTVTKNIIKEINFGSGRTEKITEPIIITGEDDWAKVIVTYIPSDIKGLKYIEDVQEKIQAGFSPTKDEINLDEKVKKKAAKMKAHIVLVESKKQHQSGQTVITGKAYGY